MKNLVFGALFLALVGIGLISCKKTEIIEIEEFTQKSTSNEKNEILAPPSWKTYLCALGYQGGLPVFGYKCLGSDGNCNKYIPDCTPFGTKSGAANFGEVLVHELILVDHEMILNNIEVFQPLIDEGVIRLDN